MTEELLEGDEWLLRAAGDVRDKPRGGGREEEVELELNEEEEGSSMSLEVDRFESGGAC